MSDITVLNKKAIAVVIAAAAPTIRLMNVAGSMALQTSHADDKNVANANKV